jgi:LacI family transcriptional regulator
MTITLEQVAKLAGVSLTTASRVINGQPGVRSETRERVLQVIREVGYQPDPVARSLAAQRLRKEA